MTETEVLDHGYIRLVDYMGSDLSIVRAARVSYDAAWRAGEDGDGDASRYLYPIDPDAVEPIETEREVTA